jgi:hypothetical protein
MTECRCCCLRCDEICASFPVLVMICMYVCSRSIDVDGIACAFAKILPHFSYVCSCSTYMQVR